MFELINGWMALGALGASIPVIIHLLNRRRFKITRWAAMEFLLASLRKNYKRVRMENLLLLLLRVLMFILIALALARPRVTESGALGALGTESRHAIIVLDNSFSMGYREGSDTCFDRAKDVAQQILNSLDTGDVISLLAMSDVTRPVIKQATLDVGLVRQEVKRIRRGWGATDVRAALVAAAGLLDSTKKPRKEIFIITDMQALGWGNKGAEPSSELESALEHIRKQAKVFVVDVGSAEPENLAVTKLAPVSSIIGTGTQSEFEGEGSNFGRTQKSGVQLRCLVDKFNQGVKTLDIPPGKSKTTTLTHSFHTKGMHVIQVQLGEDRLPPDNVRHLAVNVEEFVRTLLVNGETSTEPDENETYFIERALSPPTEQVGLKVSHVKPTTITEFGISGADFAKYRLVVLANLASLAAEKPVLRLEDYVKRGGALVVFLGDRVDAAFYNQRLFKDGNGLLPARLGSEMGTTGPNRKGTHIELLKPVHPAFRRFTGEKAFFISRSVLFYKYYELHLPKQLEDVRVVAQFHGGGPAIVEKTFGRGRVMLFASSCDAEWNNFPTSAAYLVVVHDLLRHLASGEFEQRNVIVHQPYRRTFAPAELIDTVKVRRPDGAEKELRPYLIRPAGRRASEESENATLTLTQIRFLETDVAGQYKLELRRKDGSRPPIEYFAVNVPPQESDLRRYAPDDAKAAVKGIQFEYATSLAELKLAVRQSRAGREFARPLLLALLAVTCVELILGQRFGR